MCNALLVLLSVSACILCVHIIGNGHGHMHVRSHLLLLPAYLSACEFLLQEDIWYMAPLIMRSILRQARSFNQSMTKFLSFPRA